MRTIHGVVFGLALAAACGAYVFDPNAVFSNEREQRAGGEPKVLPVLVDAGKALFIDLRKKERARCMSKIGR